MLNNGHYNFKKFCCQVKITRHGVNPGGIDSAFNGVNVYLDRLSKVSHWVSHGVKAEQGMGFIKLIGLNSLEVGLLARKFKVKGQKVEVKKSEK